MDGRVASVEAHRIATVVALDGDHPRGDVLERLLPPDALPSARAPPERKADPVGIDVDVLERDALGTDMAAREAVVRVPAYGHHLAIQVLDLQPTHRLAQRAGAVVQARGLFEVCASDGHDASYRIFPTAPLVLLRVWDRSRC
jgi:hypothetical protein